MLEVPFELYCPGRGVGKAWCESGPGLSRMVCGLWWGLESLFG